MVLSFQGTSQFIFLTFSFAGEGFLIFISISFASAGGGATGAAVPLLPPPARVNGFSAITAASAALIGSAAAKVIENH